LFINRKLIKALLTTLPVYMY